MEIKFNWLEVWDRKGREDSKDLRHLDGYENTTIDLQKVANDIIEILDIKENDKVLEIGCGAGGLAQYIKCNYVGVDYSKELVKKHIKILGNQVICCEANDLIFKDNSFDKVFCYSVFQYFSKLEYAKKSS